MQKEIYTVLNKQRKKMLLLQVVSDRIISLHLHVLF